VGLSEHLRMPAQSRWALHGSTVLFRRRNFPELTIFRTSICKSRSVSIRFRRLFSSSSALIFATSLTEKPPEFNTLR
jgi:hypothetical protein